jgi:hypothetical protein
MKRTRISGPSGTDEAVTKAVLSRAIEALPRQQQTKAGVLDLLPGEDVRMTVPRVKLIIGEYEVGSGTLFVTTE